MSASRLRSLHQIVSLLESDDPQRRWSGLDRLEHAHDLASLERIVFQDPRPSVRRDALNRIRGAQAIEPLKRIITTHTDPEIRASAVAVLSVVGTIDRVSTAPQALLELDGDALPLAAHGEWVRRLTEIAVDSASTELRGQGEARLRTQLSSNEISIRRDAILGLDSICSRRPSPERRAEITRLTVSDPDDGVRIALAMRLQSRLGRVVGPPATPEVRAWVQQTFEALGRDPVFTVRSYARRVLQREFGVEIPDTP